MAQVAILGGSFFFVTDGKWIDLDANALALLEFERKMARIRPKGKDTSAGILIPLAVIAPDRIHAHDLWVPYKAWQARQGSPPSSTLNMTELSFEELDGYDKPGCVLG